MYELKINNFFNYEIFFFILVKQNYYKMKIILIFIFNTSQSTSINFFYGQNK